MNEPKNKYFRKHFLKAMQILDMLNELLSDIDWDRNYNDVDELEEPMDEGEEELINTLYYGVEDTEAQLSDTLYESGLYEIYEEREDK